MFNYDRQLNKNEIVIYFINDSSHDYYHSIYDAMLATSDRYQMTLVTDDSDFQLQDDEVKIKHAIILTDGQDVHSITNRYQHLLNRLDSMSLAIIYPNAAAMHSARDDIEGLKAQYRDRINYLRPNISLDGMQLITHQKLIDNAVCDTKRIKYNPKHQAIDISHLQTTYQGYFREVSRIYHDYHLYHRSPSDGFFSRRVEGGILITATKTNKAQLDVRRLSLVLDYDEETNVLTYAGDYLPSSDVVEAYIVYRDNPHVKSLIHTHASDLYTRNPEFKHKIAVPISSYGVPDLGYKVNRVINNYLDDFFIMEDHGEIFVFKDEHKDSEIIEMFENKIITTCHNTVVE